MTHLVPALVWMAAALSIANTPRAVAQTTFSDGDFAPSAWTAVEVDTNEGGTATSQVVSDGNPGNALRVTLVKNAAAGFSLIAGVWLRNVPYDPAVSGGFASIDYAEDARAVQAIGNGHATGIALRQEGTIFIYRVGFTPETEWTPKQASGVVAGDFARLSGTPRILDFGPGAPPIEVGFYRADSHPASGGSQGTRIVDIDNWSVTLRPPCAGDGECEDGDACTVDACSAGVCERSPVACDDGDGCTVDACTDGLCSHTARDCSDGNECTADSCEGGSCRNPVSTTFEIVDARVADLLARIESSPCGDEELVRKVIRKLRKQLAKARASLARADRATRDRKVQALLTKARGLLGAARAFLGAAAQRGLLSPACAATLSELVDEVELCVTGLPATSP